MPQNAPDYKIASLLLPAFGRGVWVPRSCRLETWIPRLARADLYSDMRQNGLCFLVLDGRMLLVPVWLRAQMW